jgi:hypothetical protein
VEGVGVQAGGGEQYDGTLRAEVFVQSAGD